MISKNFKVLEIIDGTEYVFSAFSFKANVRKYKEDKKVLGESLTSEMVLEQIAECSHVSVDAIKNWMYAKNGPGDLEIVKAIAKFLKINYIDLLKQQEKRSMLENKIIAQDMVVDMEKTKDVIRVVYQKMSAFMDAAVRELCFDNDEATYWKYEEVYWDMIGTLHKSMLDIPIQIYDQLKGIAEGRFNIYMYGIPEVQVEVWDLTEFNEFCREENLDWDIAKIRYMEKQAEEFYAKIREILKDYLMV